MTTAGGENLVVVAIVFYLVDAPLFPYLQTVPIPPPSIAAAVASDLSAGVATVSPANSGPIPVMALHGDWRHETDSPWVLTILTPLLTRKPLEEGLCTKSQFVW